MASLVAEMPGLRSADSDMLNHASRALSLLARLEAQRRDTPKKAAGRGEPLQRVAQVVRSVITPDGKSIPLYEDPGTGDWSLSPSPTRASASAAPTQMIGSPTAAPLKDGVTLPSPGSAPARESWAHRHQPPSNIHLHKHQPPAEAAGGEQQTSVGMRIQSHRALLSSVESLLNEEGPSWPRRSLNENQAFDAGRQVASQAANKNSSLREFLMARGSPRPSHQGRSNVQQQRVSPGEHGSPPGDAEAQQLRSREIMMLRNQLSSQLNPVVTPPLDATASIQSSHPREFPDLGLRTLSEASRQMVMHTTEWGDCVVMPSPRGGGGGDAPLSARGDTREARRQLHEAERLFKESVLRDGEDGAVVQEELDAEIREGRALAV